MKVSSLPSSFLVNHDETSGFTGLRALAILGVGASGLLSFATIASADEAEDGLEEEQDEEEDTNDWVVGVDLLQISGHLANVKNRLRLPVSFVSRGRHPDRMR